MKWFKMARNLFLRISASQSRLLIPNNQPPICKVFLNHSFITFDPHPPLWLNLQEFLLHFSSSSPSEFFFSSTKYLPLFKTFLLSLQDIGSWFNLADLSRTNCSCCILETHNSIVVNFLVFDCTPPRYSCCGRRQGKEGCKKKWACCRSKSYFQYQHHFH